MKVLVLGGTRGVGQSFVLRAHRGGHAVTVFARSRASTTVWLPSGVAVFEGDAKDRAAVTNAVPGHDAVVVSLGPTGIERVQHFIHHATAWLVQAMRRNDVRRLLFMSGLGVGDSRKQAPGVMRWLAIPTILGPTFADRGRAERVVQRSGLDWTIVRPLYLTDDEPTGRWQATLDGRHVRKGIARQDVAAFLLQELERGDFLRKAVAIQAP